MDISQMQSRVFYLAGALDEAKRQFNDALKELENVKKEPVNSEPSNTTPTSN